MTRMTISPGSDQNSEVVKVDVSRPKLHNCQSHKFVDYEITIETTNKAFFRKHSVVRRRYSDFCWLRAKLSSTEINGFSSSRKIPSLPPKNYFGRFDRELICSRQQGLQDFLEWVVKINSFLSFAGLHLFLQTRLSIQEIEGFHEGMYGEHASVEELISSQEIASESEKERQLCTSKDCVEITAFVDGDISKGENTPTEIDGVESSGSLSGSTEEAKRFRERSTFMYTMYK